MTRKWLVRMVIEMNDPDDTVGDPYYEDQEVPFQLREWFDDALYDRSDHPKITWSEFVLQEERRLYETTPAADTGEINIVRGRE